MTDTQTPINFIRHIINDDLSSNKHSTIQTRFPPEPNGFLHIGHAKSICLNFELAKDYQGRCNLRFDDTNPEKESLEYINAIKKDIEWLGFSWHKECYSSNYFAQFYQYAQELIKKDLAYVCFLDAEQTREYRGTLTQAGKNSPHRANSVEQNLALFTQMKNKEFKQGECVLRAKIDMASPFICLRDPTLYRVRFQTHHQTSDDWCIYPMYDFAHCISDAIEAISHSLCTLEFQDNRRLYDWILEHLDDFNRPDRPHQYEFSRLNLERTLMSKRKLQQLVENKLVTGWDDPRMPTISGLRRRGYTPKSIIEFTNRIGISKIDSTTDMAILESCIRDDLNANAPRSMAVLNPIKVIISNYPTDQLETLSAPIHPQNEAMGKRDIFFGREIYIDANDFTETPPNNKYKRLAINKEVRLRNAYVINATEATTDEAGNIIVYATYDAQTLGKNPADGRKVKGVIHFVEASKALKASFMIYEQLLDDSYNPDDPTPAINPNSAHCQQGFVEPELINAQPYAAYQFEREGYFCRDNQSKDLVFNKTVGLRDVWQGK